MTSIEIEHIDEMMRSENPDGTVRITPWRQAIENFSVDAGSALAEHGASSFFSVAGNAAADRFRVFVNRHAVGSILDVGCGAQWKPLYLADIRDEHITGIDPMPAPHPFAFVCTTVEEFSPDWLWGTVVCATSLDHVADVRAAVDKMKSLATLRLIFWHENTLQPQPAEQHTFGVTHDALKQMLGCKLIEQDGDFMAFKP